MTSPPCLKPSIKAGDIEKGSPSKSQKGASTQYLSTDQICF